MATRRQHEAAAPRTAAIAAMQCPARSGRNQTAAAAARSGPRNQTAAVAAAPSGPRNQAAAVAATCRPHARNRRALGDIGNHVNAPVVDRDANRRRLTRSLSARPNAATADVSTIAPARPAAAEGANASRVVTVSGSGENKKLTKGATTTTVTRTGAETDATADSLMKRVAAAEAKAARAVEELKGTASLLPVLNDYCHKIARKIHRYELFMTKSTQTVDKLHALVGKKESELQKVMELNVRLLCVVDQKEAQLQAMSEQCRALALNSN